MARPRKIPEQQLARVHRLEAILSAATEVGDLPRAKIALDDLRPILERYHHNHRVLEAYLMLYETALEAWDLDLAKRGFEFVRREANKRTRLSLEATVLLALAHLRSQDLFSAEPLMAEALRNDDVITSKPQRDAFRREAIERFDQDGALASMARLHPEVIHEAQRSDSSARVLMNRISRRIWALAFPKRSKTSSSRWMCCRESYFLMKPVFCCPAPGMSSRTGRWHSLSSAPQSGVCTEWCAMRTLRHTKRGSMADSPRSAAEATLPVLL